MKSPFALVLTLALLAADSLTAQQFRLTIGPPIAANASGGKKSVLAVRIDGCSEPAKTQLTGTAEGFVKGKRQSIPLVLRPGAAPCVYAVGQNWPAEGVWVMKFTSSYQNQQAGALVPMGPEGFLRERSKFFPRPATPAEIDAALSALLKAGGTK